MDPRLQSSFIPKKPIDSSPRSIGVAHFNIFNFIGYVVFILVVVATGGLFFMTHSVQPKTLATKVQQLQKAKESLNPEILKKLARLDLRIKTINTVLDKHISPSSVFLALGDVTSKYVQYDSFSYDFTGTSTVAVDIGGIAKSYNSVAFQSDAFRADKTFINPMFSDIGLNDRGQVTFKIKAQVAPSIILYKNSFLAPGSGTTVTNN